MNNINSLILNITVANIWLIVNLFMRIQAGVTYFNPQTCLLCFIFGSLSVMAFFRLPRRKQILKLFEKILQYHHPNRSEVYRRKKWVLWFVSLYMFAESVAMIMSITTVIFTLNLNLEAVLKQLFTFILPVAFIILVPVTLENQYAICCIILANAFDELNDRFDDLIKKGDKYFTDKLEIIKRDRKSMMQTVMLLNREYGLELFLLSNTILMVAVYLCDDIVMMINYKSFGNATYLYKLTFNFYSLGGLVCRLCWICHETEQLNQKIKNTEKVILKYDIHAMSIKICNKLEKYLKQLNTTPDDTAIFGFFRLNMEFAFNTFGTVFAFVMIFAQLNFSEKWIQ